MDNINTCLKVNLKYFRIKKELSQQRLAELCDISTSFVADIELGRRLPSLHTLQKLADVLNIEPYRFLINQDKHKNSIVSNFKKELIESLKNEINKIEKSI